MDRGSGHSVDAVASSLEGVHISDTSVEPATISRCPGARIVNYPSTWYHMQSVPDFLICHSCYTGHIVPSFIKTLFKEVQKPRGRCGFHVPRIQRRLWPAFLKDKNAAPTVTFMVDRSSVPNCPGDGTVTGEAGIEWFQTKGSNIDGFVACQACHEDYIVGSAFENRFSPSGIEQGHDNPWSCDMASPAIAHQFELQERKGGKNAWKAFAQATRDILKQPPCIPGNDVRTVQAVGQAGEVAMCTTCVRQKLTGAFEGNFNFSNETPGDDASCCFLQAPVLKFAHRTAWECGDLGVFWTAARAVAADAHCHLAAGEGEEDDPAWSKCYVFKTSPGSYLEVCPGCYAAVVVPLGARHLFSLEMRHSGTRHCDLHNESDRNAYTRWIAEAVEKGDADILMQYVVRAANTPVCPRSETTLDTQWYGFPEFLVCAWCYEREVVGTTLEDAFPLEGEIISEPGICQFWLGSEEMREKFRTACAASSSDILQDYGLEIGIGGVGDRSGGSGVADAYWSSPGSRGGEHLDDGEVAAALRMEMASQLYMQSISNRTYNNAISYIGDDDGMRYGNDELGWHRTQAGADAEEMEREAILLLSGGQASARPYGYTDYSDYI